MKIENSLSDLSVLRELGHRLARARLERNMTQAQLAHESGVAVRTLRRLESGEVAAQLSAFIRVCRALKFLDRLENLIPESAPTPMAQLKSRTRQRRRASKRATKPASGRGAPPPSTIWTWDEKS